MLGLIHTGLIPVFYYYFFYVDTLTRQPFSICLFVCICNDLRAARRLSPLFAAAFCASIFLEPVHLVGFGAPPVVSDVRFIPLASCLAVFFFFSLKSQRADVPNDGPGRGRGGADWCNL